MGEIGSKIFISKWMNSSVKNIILSVAPFGLAPNNLCQGLLENPIWENSQLSDAKTVNEGNAEIICSEPDTFYQSTGFQCQFVRYN